MSNLFYNRDQNITGANVLTGIPFSPSYGSSASFTTRASEIRYPNRVVRRMGQSLNSVLGEYNLSFRLRDEDSRDVINYLESRRGTLPVVLQDASSIYQTISGFADNFSWTARSNSENEISARIVIDNRSPQLNWSGLSFVNHEFQQWQTGENVPRYAVRYFQASNQSSFDNFFYCTGDHVSSYENGPFSTGSMWTQNLFLDESFEYSVSTRPDVSRIEFNNSFFQRIKDKDNINSVENLTLRFNGLNNRQTKALLHFVESKFGEIKFPYLLPKVYNRNKIFYCPSWRHTWLFDNSNNVELDLFEDPMGILQQDNSPSIVLNANGNRSSVTFQTSSVNAMSLVSYNGADKTSLPDGQTIKALNGNEEIRLFGALTGLKMNAQSVNSLVVSNQSPLVEIDAPQNHVNQVILNEARRIKFLNLSGNNLREIDTSNITGLQVLDVSDNRISELDVSSNNGLTGIYVAGNQISSESFGVCLDALVNFGGHSGEFFARDVNFPDFATNSGLSGGAFNDFSTLGWRGWRMNFDNAEYPLDVSGLSNPVCHFQQENITGYNGGQSIFLWSDYVGNFNAFRSTIPDSSRPIFVERAVNARSSLRFNGQSYLEQLNYAATSTIYSLFAVVKAESSDLMAVYSDFWDRGMYVSGNQLMHKTNFVNAWFGELSGGYNVLGIYTSGSVVSGAVNSLTPILGPNKFGATNFSLPGIIGWNRYGPSGVITEELTSPNRRPAPFIGEISEILFTTGSVNFEVIMRDLAAKHGIHLT